MLKEREISKFYDTLAVVTVLIRTYSEEYSLNCLWRNMCILMKSFTWYFAMFKVDNIDDSAYLKSDLLRILLVTWILF